MDSYTFTWTTEGDIGRRTCSSPSPSVALARALEEVHLAERNGWTVLSMTTFEQPEKGWTVQIVTWEPETQEARANNG